AVDLPSPARPDTSTVLWRSHIPTGESPRMKHDTTAPRIRSDGRRDRLDVLAQGCLEAEHVGGIIGGLTRGSGIRVAYPTARGRGGSSTLLIAAGHSARDDRVPDAAGVEGLAQPAWVNGGSARSPGPGDQRGPGDCQRNVRASYVRRGRRRRMLGLPPG